MLRTAARGYERRAVEELLARCAASLGEAVRDFPELGGVAPADPDAPPLDAGDVRAVRFPVVLRGYDVPQVDDLLRRVAAALPGERPGWDDPPAVPAVPAAAGGGPELRAVVRGYDREEVDAFLVRCAHSLGSRVDAVPELRPLLAQPRTGDRLRARDVETVQFPVRLRGYAVHEVDALLDRVATALGR